MLCNLHRVGAGITANMEIKKHNEADINIGKTPWQHLRKMVSGLASRTRTRAAADTRHDNQGSYEIDIKISVNDPVKGISDENVHVDRCRSTRIATP